MPNTSSEIPFELIPVEELSAVSCDHDNPIDKLATDPWGHVSGDRAYKEVENPWGGEYERRKVARLTD